MQTPSTASFPRSTLAWSAALLAGLALAGPGLAQSPAAFAAKVNGEAQPPERGQLLLQDQVGRGAANTPQLQSGLREALINQAVMAQEAVKAGLDQQPQVRARLDLARQNALAQAWQQQELQGIQPTEAAIEAEYQRQVQALGTHEVRLRHVLVADPQQAGEVHAQLKGGAPFVQVVAQFSSDASTRATGGLTEWVPLGRLAPAVASALQGLEPGQLAAAPVATGAGWQVLRLEQQRPFTAPALAQVRPQLIQALARQTLQARIQALREKAKVE